MSYWCDNKLTITGPNRQAVLNAVRGEAAGDEDPPVIFFSIAALRRSANAAGIPIPDTSAYRDKETPLGSVYVYDQHHESTADSDVLFFETQWVEPVEAVTVLSQMFPENTFRLEAWCPDLAVMNEETGDTDLREVDDQTCCSLFKNGVETKTVPVFCGRAYVSKKEETNA